MNLLSPSADIYIPDGAPIESALPRITHLGVGAHQDDLEFMAFHGIIECFQHEGGRYFGGVTCTDGAGSARTGRYAGFTDEEMKQRRCEEQRAAAFVGRYGAMIQLGYSSAVTKSPSDERLTADLEQILRAARPEVVYTHNICDKHDTHIGVVVALITAARRLEPSIRPKKLLGCEVWRDLDWLDDASKVVLDVSGWDHLASAMNGIFDSQIAGGKRYDAAIHGRRAANATFHQSHTTDAASQVMFAMDLTPLLDNPESSIVDFATDFLDNFRSDVRNKLMQRLGA